MERVEVTPSQVRALAKSLEAAAAGIDAELEQLDEAMERLLLEWQGDAQLAFQRAQTRFRVIMGERRETLITIAGAVTAVADGYGVTDREAARALGGQ